MTWLIELRKGPACEYIYVVIRSQNLYFGLATLDSDNYCYPSSWACLLDIEGADRSEFR